MTRPWTPDRRTPNGSTTITSKRACNGCGELLGDVTGLETAFAIAGQPLPDVRRECPACAPTAPEPACRPMRIVSGDAPCVEATCDHEPNVGDYCDAVVEETVCATHCEITSTGGIRQAEPWPCQRAKAVTA